MSSYRAPGSSWGLCCPRLGLPPFPGPLEEKAALTVPDTPSSPFPQHVPLIVAACCRIVEARGLESTGIYRVPGNNAVVCSLQEQLNRGPGDINLQDEVGVAAGPWGRGQAGVRAAVVFIVPWAPGWARRDLPLQASPGDGHRPS